MTPDDTAADGYYADDDMGDDKIDLSFLDQDEADDGASKPAEPDGPQQK